MTSTEGLLDGLQPIQEKGWRSGLSGLMSTGFGAWWKTSQWWRQALLWTAILNGSLAITIWGDVTDAVTTFTLYGVMTIFSAVAVVIVMQEAVVGEKRSGTAAWIHSKPVSRQAFIIAKLVPNAAGVLATMIAIPSIVLVIQMQLAGVDYSIANFAMGAKCVTAANHELLAAVKLVHHAGQQPAKC